jgi:hypothetical protein
MFKSYTVLLTAAVLMSCFGTVNAQYADTEVRSTLYDVPPRVLIDVPTAGTLPRGYFDIGIRLYNDGGAIGSNNIGLSNRLMIGISYGGEQVISNHTPNWNPTIEFSLKFRLVDELQYFPAIAIGYSSQGDGAWNNENKRYTFKSRGFYAVASRSFYFYQWTAGWHGGINYSRENTVDHDKKLNLFGGFDATFKYNLAYLAEYDFALNDTKSAYFGGKGRGYLNMAVKWLFTENLEIELIAKDMLVNRHEASTISREMRITYIDRF